MQHYKSQLVWYFILLVSLVRAVSSFLNNLIIPILTKPLTLAENTAFGKSWWNTKKPFSYFFNLKTQWQKGTSENALNIHVPELGHARRVLLILTLASCESPRSGLINASSPQLWGSPAVPCHGSVPILGRMCCPLSPIEAGRRAGGARHCPSPATHTTTTELGEPWQMLPTAYQGCLLTIHCLGWQYSAYGFVTTSLWVLFTSLALAQHYGQNPVSQIEEFVWLSEKKSIVGKHLYFNKGTFDLVDFPIQTRSRIPEQLYHHKNGTAHHDG